MLKMKIKNLWLRLLFVVLAVLVIGVVLMSRYDKSTRELRKENFPLWERINQFIEKGWEFKIGETEAEIRNNLGTPWRELHIREFFMKMAYF